MYFNIFFPFVVLLALLIRGSTLDGAENGVLLYIIPRWELLLDVNIWGNAASQTFYAFGIGYGSLITLSSFCNFNNNCHRDVLILTAVNIFTSIFAGFSIFTILGYLAYQMDVPVEDVARDGPGLAFVAYPEAVLQMPLSQLWAVVFFLMLLTLGLGAQFSGVEALITGILDTWPKLRERRAVVTVLTCSCYFLLSLPMCCNGGMFMFSLLEWNTASWQIFIIGLAEVGVVAWSYGGRRFLGNVEEMGIKLPKIIAHYWWICLVVLTPLTLIVSLKWKSIFCFIYFLISGNFYTYCVKIHDGFFERLCLSRLGKCNRVANKYVDISSFAHFCRNHFIFKKIRK